MHENTANRLQLYCMKRWSVIPPMEPICTVVVPYGLHIFSALVLESCLTICELGIGFFMAEQ